MSQKKLDVYMPQENEQKAINDNFTELYAGAGGGGSSNYVIEWEFTGSGSTPTNLDYGTFEDLADAVVNNQNLILVDRSITDGFHICNIISARYTVESEESQSIELYLHNGSYLYDLIIRSNGSTYYTSWGGY